MLVETVGILAITSIGGSARGLNITDAIRSGAEHAQESFRMHGPGADFGVVGLVEHATFTTPEMHKLEDQFLKQQALGLALHSRFLLHGVSKSSRVPSFRSA